MTREEKTKKCNYIQKWADLKGQNKKVSKQ